MATREGIYVGDREITQRYVGSRLVWEKVKWIYKTETDVREISVYGNEITITFRSVLFERTLNVFRDPFYNRVQTGAGDNNRVFEVNVKQWISTQGGYDNARIQTASGIVLTCKNNQEATELKNLIDRTGILKIYNKH